MNLKERMKNGSLYYEYGHRTKEEKEEEKKLEDARIECKELLYDYNLSRPGEAKRREELLHDIFAVAGEHITIEPPLHASYGIHTTIGNDFYANFNLVLVDDGAITIKDHVMIGPNVTICTTGHPIWPDYRRNGSQFSLPITIENDVWIGSNVVILPGVTIGKYSVIGAGSIVTKDIPAGVVAYGQPCEVVRQIGGKDRFYYAKNKEVDEEFLNELEKMQKQSERKKERAKQKKKTKHFLNIFR